MEDGNKMKCKSVKGLLRAIKTKKAAAIKVWDIMDNYFKKGGAYLNLGNGKYSYVGKDTWLSIRDYIVDQAGIPCSTIAKYNRFYK